MQEQTQAIQAHYDANPKKEWDRLKGFHPYEKYITLRMMNRYVRPGDSILDVGGGPGHYAVHFARAGHDVTLVDLSRENVRFAKKKARQYGVYFTAMQGDALDLSRFQDSSFDQVFLMGPLYHLMNEDARIRAVEEAKRVLKPGGCLFCSFILMFGGVIYGLREVPETIFWPGEQEYFEIAARGEGASFEAFTYAHMTTVAEVKKLFAQIPGLKKETIFGQESILAPYRNILKAKPRKLRQAWYDYALRFCDQEEYLTHSEHLMYVARKTE